MRKPLSSEKRADREYKMQYPHQACLQRCVCFNNCFPSCVLALCAIRVASVSIPERLEEKERQRYHLWHWLWREELSSTAALTLKHATEVTRQSGRGGNSNNASADCHRIWTLNVHSSPCLSFRFTKTWKRPVAGACLKTKSFNKHKQGLNDWKNRGKGLYLIRRWASRSQNTK